MEFLLLLLGVGLIAGLTGAFGGSDDDRESPEPEEQDDAPQILTDGYDTFDAGGGNDEVRGLRGFDDIFGGTGNDSLYGDEGKDLLVGGAGNDLLDGGVWNDGLFGEAGNDRLYGGAGNDILIGGAGNDLLDGGQGTDYLSGGTGSDTLLGGEGDDVLLAAPQLAPEITLQDYRVWRAGGDLPPGGLTADAYPVDRDVLNGGGGDDLLFLANGTTATGGNGSDVFVMGDWIKTGGSAATITDFDPQEDGLAYFADGNGPAPDLRLDRVTDGHYRLYDGDVLTADVTGDFTTLPSILPIAVGPYSPAP